MAEARRWLDEHRFTENVATVVLLGAGLGYVLDAIEERAPECRVAVIEPIAACARALLARKDWTGWFETDRLRLVVGPEYAGATTAWRGFETATSETPILVHPVLARESPDDIVAARRAAVQLLFGSRANGDARRHNAARYLLNTLTNIPQISASADVSSLFDRFTGLPAIVISAGPSLDNTIENLAALRKSVVLVAVDTALRPLLTAGVHPHLVVAVDPNPSNAEHFRGLPPAPDTWLVTEGSLDPTVVRQFVDRTFCFRVGEHHPWPWLRSHGCERGQLAAHGSVATVALDLARNLGCDPIVFCGQDLAFTAGRSYCAGTSRDLWPPLTSGWPAIPALDVTGGMTSTASHLVAFRDWMVERATADSNRRYINSTGAGILHGGRIEVLPLARALTSPLASQANVIDDILRASFVRDAQLPVAMGEAARLLAADLRNGRAADEPFGSWQSFTAGTLRQVDACLALEADSASVPPDTLRTRLYEDVAKAARDQIAIATGQSPFIGTPDNPISACERIMTVYRHLAHARGWQSGTLLSRQDVLRFAQLVTDSGPRTILVIEEHVGATTLIAEQLVPVDVTIDAMSAAAGSPAPADLIADVASMSGVTSRARWLHVAGASAIPSDAAYDLIVMHVSEPDDAEAWLPRIPRLLRPGGLLCLVDCIDRITGSSVRRLALRMTERVPEMSLAPLRTTNRFSRLSPLRRASTASVAHPVPLYSARDAAVVAELVTRRFQSDSVVVFGRAATDWAASFTRGTRTVHTVPLETLLSTHAPELPKGDVALCLDTMEFVDPRHEAAVLAQVVRCADTVLFATPTPGFFGSGYPNDKPIGYWAERFLEHGFVLEDTLRPTLEDRRDVSLRNLDFTLFCARRISSETDRQAIMSSSFLRTTMASQLERIDDLFLQAGTLRLTLRESAAAGDADHGLLPATTDVLPIATAEIEHVVANRYSARFLDTKTRMCQHLGLLRRAILEEDGIPLVEPDALMDDLQQIGRGRYYVATDVIHFATSDNSDPRANNRRYQLRVPAMVARLIRDS